MPEESIAAYNNIFLTFLVVSGVILFIFLILFLISRALVYNSEYKFYKSVENEKREGIKDYLKSIIDNIEINKKNEQSYFINIKSDPYMYKNIFVFYIIFIFSIFFIISTILVLNFAQVQELGWGIFLILILVFFMITISVYIVKSKILR